MMWFASGIRNYLGQVALLAFSLAAGLGLAHAHMGPTPIGLKGVPAPPVPGLTDGSDPIVVDKQKAIALGKALFWDANVGSDSQACASCHFHAGADVRVKNQISPVGEAGDTGNGMAFEPGVDAYARGANYRLRRADFPFNQMRDPLRDLEPDGFLRVSDDVVGSGGSFGGDFRTSELMDTVVDDCQRQPDDIFHVHGVGARRVTARNAPSVINAVFNHRNFWDGRANNVFNGSSPWGDRDPDAGVWVKQADGTVVKQRLRLVNSSLASQAISPLTNTTEMVCAGRRMADLGRKLQLRRPLEHQNVHWNDSVLGAYAYSTAGNLKPGLKTYYFKLIQGAFNRKYWSSPLRGPFGAPNPQSQEDRPMPYSQLEANFGMFFALAVQLYESTLISDDTSFDRSRWDDQGNPVDLTPAQQRGMQVFRDAHCALCHVGPTFTAAAVHTNAEVALLHPEAFGDSAFKVSATHNVVDRQRGLKGNGFVDTGFVATGVGLDDWDRGLGGVDAFGHPLSFAEQYMQHLAGNPAGVLDPEVTDTRACDLSLAIARNVNSPTFIFSPKDGVMPQPQDTANCFLAANAFLPTPAAAARELANPASRKMLTIVDGAYKVPGLRNVELTGPYMHNGGMASLEEVVEFYARGGNFETASKQFGLVFPQPDLQLDAEKRSDLIEFLKSLTDDRVRYERAPFDHPELAVPAGHGGDHVQARAGNPLDTALAVDEYLVIPAVGADGTGTPLKPFEEYLDE